MAHYWRYKRPLDYPDASKVANDVVSLAAFPQYLERWLDRQIENRNAMHPVVRFLINLNVDYYRK